MIEDSLPQPFFEEGHQRARAKWRADVAPELALVEQRFAAGELDEDAAAREFVQTLARHEVLHDVVHGDARSLCTAREEVAAASGFADSVLALQGLGSYAIVLGGDPEQAARYVNTAARGECVAAFALTEPGAGSDARSIETTARRDGDGYVLDGTKTFITNAGVADYYTVFARLDDGEGGVALVVESSNPGLSISERFRGMAPHPLGSVALSACRVGQEARVGAEGEGLDLAFRTLNRFRPSVGAAALGMARRALLESLEWTKGRQQFGRPLANFQLVKSDLAQMWADLESARLTVYRAAWLLDQGGSAAGTEPASSLAKLLATEAAGRIADRAVQLAGARGVVEGAAVERIYREVRALRIYEGTSEIQKLILAGHLLRASGPSEPSP